MCVCALNLTLEPLRKYILYSFFNTELYHISHIIISNSFFIKGKYKEGSVLEKRSSEERVTPISYKVLNQNFMKIKMLPVQSDGQILSLYPSNIKAFF